MSAQSTDAEGESEEPLHIVVYFSEESAEGYPFNIPEYRQSYFDFFSFSVREHSHVKFFICRGRSYLGDGKFSKGEFFDPVTNTLIPENEVIHANLVYNKGDLLIASGDRVSLVNDLEFDRICCDKAQSAFLFPEEFPKTIEVFSADEVVDASSQLHTDRFVVKPARGQEGKGVKIFSKTDFQEYKYNAKGPLVVQEFLDTSHGIPGICDAEHDLRVLLMNGEIVQAYVRTPQKGKLLSNVSKGASLLEIEKDALSETLLRIVRKVDTKFSGFFPRIYSVDFGYTPDGWKIFEFNSQPGLPYPSWDKYYHRWHKKLIETLLSHPLLHAPS